MDKKAKTKLLVVALISSFITTFMGSALNLSIPNIQYYFDVSTASVGWIINSYMFTCAVLAVPLGIMGDIYGKKPLLICGLLVFCASSLGAIFSKNIMLLAVIRGIQGMGTAMIYSTNIAILVENSEPKQKGKYLGIVTSANYLGLSAGPVLGGIINYYFQWKGIFIVSAFISAIALFLSLKGTSSKRKDAKITKNDFVMLFKNKKYLTTNLATFINFGATFAISYMISTYLQEIKGFNSKVAGLILVSAPIIQTIISPIVGKLSDKFSPFKLSALGMAACSVAVLSFAFIDDKTSLVVIIILLALSGLGSGLFSAPNTNAVMSIVDSNYYGIASSVLSTMRSLGHTGVTSIIMFLGDMKISFIVIGIVCICGIFIALYNKS